MAQEEHLKLLAGAVLLAADLVAGADEAAEGFVLGVGRVDGGEFVGAEEPGQLYGVAAVGFDAVDGLARDFGGRR